MATRRSVERWLRKKESVVLPRWMAELQRKHKLISPSNKTNELQQSIFFIYYDQLCQAVITGMPETTDPMLRQLVSDHVDQNYDIKQILQFPLQLKSTLWQLISQDFALDRAQEMMDRLDIILDHSTGVLVETYTHVTDSALSDQLAEMDFLTQRLALASEETEQAFTQLRSLYNISQAISSTLDIHETLEAVADNLAAISTIERCTIWLATSENTLQAGVTKGEGDTAIGTVTLFLDKQASFVTQALLTHQEQRFERPDDALAPCLSDRIAMAVPMFHENRPVGVVMIDGPSQNRTFSSSTASLIRAATEQTAVALENAQLYGQVMRFNQELEAKVRQRTAELQEINEELERLNDDLENLDRTKSDFISIAAHELKTPLTLIQGYTNIMRDDKTIKSNSFLLNILTGIIKGSERLYGIIESMIDVSMIDSQVLQLKPAQCALGHILRTLSEHYAPDLKERYLALRLGDFKLPYIEADVQRLYQVFDNLLLNAIKYTPDGGWIAIDAWQIYALEDEDWIEVVISDSGIGIDPEHQERIFDKFYQTGQVALHSSGKTKFKGGGPGLGLAIAKGIVHAHGGKIWVESEKCDEQACPGSQFHVVLPVKSKVNITEVSSPFSYARPAD
jgi:signal transduction histidine kinase